MKAERLICVLCLICTLGCIEKFNPDIELSEDQYLVIEGMITDESRAYTIHISKTLNTQGSNTPIMVMEAEVTVVDDLGNSFIFEEVSPGTYQSNPIEFTGEVGRSYQLVIKVEGSTYQSNFEEMRPSYAIDSVYADFEFKPIQSETGEIVNEPLLNVYADINFPDGSYYYRYEWEATYQARTPLQGSGICWEGGVDGNPYGDSDPSLRCYVNEESYGFLKLFTNEGLLGNSFDQLLVYSIDPNKRLQFKYSPFIKQYSLTPTAYSFWKAVDNQITNVGGLFDAPPTQIIGNIKNFNNSDEVVLGLFSVSSVVSYRSFVSSSILEQEFDHYGGDCSPAGGGLTPPPPPPTSCCECRILPNSTDVKPDYWID